MATVRDADRMLDNMAWHALTGAQAHLATVSTNGLAARYRHRVGLIYGVDELEPEAWAGLAELAGPGGVMSLFRDRLGPAPDGWTEMLNSKTAQYLAGELDDPPDIGIEELGPEDAKDMLALARLTEPGPFGPETHLHGRYFGLRRDGALVAMAGERMRVDGWGEVSAVCVHPGSQNEGLGAALTLAAAKAITDRGDRAMLHVAEANDPAHRLYLRLGFEVRRHVAVGVYRFGDR